MLKLKKHLAVLATSGAVVVSMLAGGAPAHADRAQVGASGNTVIRLGGQLARALQTNGCGFLQYLSTTGGANGTILQDGRVLQLTFPIQDAVFSGANGIRVNHDGGLELANACFDLKFTNLVVQNFGDADQLVTLDVLAKTFEDGTNVGRTSFFTLDLSGANFTFKKNGRNVKIRGMDVLLAEDGAAELNTLATGAPTGPLAAGDRVGSARTSVLFTF